MSATRLPPDWEGGDVFDLPEDQRVSLSTAYKTYGFALAGIDDCTPVDKVLAGNGRDYFVTSL